VTERWLVADVAAYLGVATSTVRAYVTRGHLPAPDGRLGRTPWWRPETIRGFTRPGQGARTDVRHG
jgi:hypothetical protein